MSHAQQGQAHRAPPQSKLNLRELRQLEHLESAWRVSAGAALPRCFAKYLSASAGACVSFDACAANADASLPSRLNTIAANAFVMSAKPAHTVRLYVGCAMRYGWPYTRLSASASLAISYSSASAHQNPALCHPEYQWAQCVFLQTIDSTPTTSDQVCHSLGLRATGS